MRHAGDRLEGSERERFRPVRQHDRVEQERFHVLGVAFGVLLGDFLQRLGDLDMRRARQTGERIDRKRFAGDEEQRLEGTLQDAGFDQLSLHVLPLVRTATSAAVPRESPARRRGAADGSIRESRGTSR